MERPFTPEDLSESIAGNLEAFTFLAKQDHDLLLNHSLFLPELVLTRNALVRVLRALQSGSAAPELVQQWASFVMRGYVADSYAAYPKPHLPIKPLDIHYEQANEQQIADVVSRLEEIGDLIDGEITDEEIPRLIAMLD